MEISHRRPSDPKLGRAYNIGIEKPTQIHINTQDPEYKIKF